MGDGPRFPPRRSSHGGKSGTADGFSIEPYEHCKMNNLRLAAASRICHLVAYTVLAVLLAGCAVPEVNGPTRIHQVEGYKDPAYFYLDVSRREGVVQESFVMKPNSPVATVILFTGGDGKARVTPRGSRNTNFLIRSRGHFISEDLMVVIVDLPSDRVTLDSFRHSEAHAIDIKGVIAEARKLANVPVWLVGTSAGSASAASVASRLPPPAGPDGIVLTASANRHPKGNAVLDARLGDIRVPALVVHHESDACQWTPYHGAVNVLNELRNAPARHLLSFRGGAHPIGDPCEPLHYHGFFGIEKQVVVEIADWIKANSPQQK